MSGDNYKYQASLKFGAGGVGMLNIRADTPDEFRDSITHAVGTCAELAVLAEAFNTEFAAVSNLAQGGFQVSQVQQQQPQRVASAGELCQHGPMVFRSGTSAKGEWSGWFCPTAKDAPDKCKPKFK